MNASISIRLDADVSENLEAEARSQGIGLATYLRRLAAEAAREARRARIRIGSAGVARQIVENPEARAFMENWTVER